MSSIPGGPQRETIQPQKQQSPVSRSTGAELRERSDELPPSARPAAEDKSRQKDRTGGRGKFWAVVGGVILAAAVGIAAVQFPWGEFSANPEIRSQNWKHHQDVATQAAANSGDSTMKWVSWGGVSTFGTEISVSEKDRDMATTEAVKAALKAGDRQQAEEILAEAQRPPQIDGASVGSKDVTPNAVAVDGTTPAAEPVAPAAEPDSPLPEAGPTPDSEPPQPKISDGLREEILRGDTEFFHIYLYDSCYQDGDVVKVLLNGQPFQYVPITHAGATLSVPVSTAAPTSIAIEGVYDGGGGITVACRTSQGDGFIRVMAPGEVRHLGIVGK